MLKKSLFSLIAILFLYSFLYPQNSVVDTVKYNFNLSKSTNVKWIDGKPMYIHIVNEKQTLYSISKLYDVPISEIMFINKILSADEIQIEQMLMIPAKDVDNKLPPAPNIYIKDTTNYYYVEIEPKETLYHLSKEYNISIEQIKNANDGLKEGLAANSIVKIPKQIIVEDVKSEDNDTAILCKDTISVGFTTHKVANKETLVQIAKQYSINADDILKYNPKAARRLKDNMILNIPTFELKQREKEPIILVHKEGATDSIFSNSKIKSLRKYKIALLIPLYYEDVDGLIVDKNTGNIKEGSNKPFRFIQLYQGAKLAADSLSKQGMNIDLYVYDVDETSEKVNNLINKDVLKEFDLIIGPFYTQAFNEVCKYASNYNIPIINLTSSMRENLCDYNKSFKVNVDNTTKYTYLANYILTNYSNANIIFYFSKTPSSEQNEAIKYLKDRLSNAIPERIKFSNIDIYNVLVKESAMDSTLPKGITYNNITIENNVVKKTDLLTRPDNYLYLKNDIKTFDYSLDGLSGYTKHLSAVRPNVFISFADDNSSIVDNLSRLNSFSNKYNVHLFGTEQWLDCDIDYKAMGLVDFHFCSSSLVDYNSVAVQNFIENYHSTYLAEPNKYAFLGYDVLFYFAKLLYLFDKNFIDYVTLIKYDGLEYSMFYNRTDSFKGFENFSAGVFKIKDLEFNKEPSADYIWEEAIDVNGIN